MSILRPAILDASVSDGTVSLVADGVTAMTMTRKQAMWLIARLAEALARSA